MKIKGYLKDFEYAIQHAKTSIKVSTQNSIALADYLIWHQRRCIKEFEGIQFKEDSKTDFITLLTLMQQTVDLLKQEVSK